MTTAKIADFVAWERLGDDVLLMDMRSGEIFRLTGAAARALVAAAAESEPDKQDDEGLAALLDAGFVLAE